MENKDLNRWLAINVRGVKELSLAEMEKEALSVWESQPGCQVFDKGFFAHREGGKVIVEQSFANYTGDDKEASKIRRQLLSMFPGCTLSLFTANGEFNASFTHGQLYHQVAEQQESLVWCQLAFKVISSITNLNDHLSL